MFWRWWAPWDFMNTEPGKHESQFEALSQRLFGRTFWGDYGGDIVTRWYYSELLENYPLAVASIEAMHGQGLVLTAVEPDNEEYRDQLREVIRFLAFFDPASSEYFYGEVWGSDYMSDWEWKLIDKELTEGWWANYTRGELVDYFADWEDNTIVPEVGTEEWAKFVWEFYRENDENYPYFESADSIVVPGWDTDAAAEWLLAQYAKSITEAGNPEVTLVSATPEYNTDYATSVAAIWNDNLNL